MTAPTDTEERVSTTDYHGSTDLSGFFSATHWTQYKLSIKGQQTRKTFVATDQDKEAFRSGISSVMQIPLDDVSVEVLSSYDADFQQGRWNSTYFGHEETARRRTSLCSLSPHALDTSSDRLCPYGSIPEELVAHIQAERDQIELMREEFEETMTTGTEDVSNNGQLDAERG
ncbi:hypothetical protein L198_02109 [Cryptococcus wingfieldii CBS 7118]|uniref:Uncharacterized protein n=1 Tax=Cryptococcus wingfieldii CBS 7118 TaxID=1295528 RepID=A0A1E3JXD2_9TREE|nr:hypothetical protein L198_02109 [Cryptococcus wingfieldii CBS 7118]ODO05416.1 hypothetical protein L198_02109 [Cryptococcus wingfieldii CBS 7118]